jgi:hypothetical protein
MNAMTWWDHKTHSVWSQPWGRAIAGPLKGTELALLPSQLVPWETWRKEHPDTLALDTGGSGMFRLGSRGATFHPNYVIGVTLGDAAGAYPFKAAAKAGIINDTVGPYPILVHVNPDTQGVYTYLRQVDDRVLTFVQEDGTVRDQQTGSTWRMEQGLALDGPLEGQVLRAVPYIPAFPSAWEDFYPDSRWYEQE